MFAELYQTLPHPLIQRTIGSEDGNEAGSTFLSCPSSVPKLFSLSKTGGKRSLHDIEAKAAEKAASQL